MGNSRHKNILFILTYQKLVILVLWMTKWHKVNVAYTNLFIYAHYFLENNIPEGVAIKFNSNSIVWALPRSIHYVFHLFRSLGLMLDGTRIRGWLKRKLLSQINTNIDLFEQKKVIIFLQFHWIFFMVQFISMILLKA